MSEEQIIGPNPCPDCGGEYGEHSMDCRNLMEHQPPKPAKRTRTVFGRVRTKIGGGEHVTMHMTKTHVVVRQRYGRRLYSLPIDKVALLVLYHSPLPK